MLLELTDVKVHYGKIEALKGISFTVAEGEVVTLIGANGAGLRPLSAGTVRFEGESIGGKRPDQLVKMGICQAPEGRGIFPGMTVVENLEMGTYARKGSRASMTPEFERVYELFPRLAERRRQTGGTLSGGEQQMLAIGRSLMAKPKVLLLDEPSMGLAPQLVAHIFSIITEINRQGITVLLVEQNAAQALRRADRAYVMETGRIVKSAPASELLADESVRNAYLGGNVEA